MKSKIKGFTIALVIFAIIVLEMIYGNYVVFAEDTVPVEEVLEEGYAGAAEDLEINSTPTDEDVQAAVEANAWKNPGSLVMTNVQNSVNVREEASADSTKVGMMYKDCAGYIVEYTDEWTHLTSGNLDGWVCNDYLIFGDEAESAAESVGVYQATVNCDSVRVRKEPSLEADTYGLVEKGDVYYVAAQDGDWITIDYEGADGFVNVSCVDIEFHIDCGETMQEISDREAAERAAKREAERIQYYGVYAATASDVEILGAIIQCEAGNQPYEGQVAVGAVVMNRVRSGAYPNSIYGVVYAAGQFTPAGSGAVDRRLAAGVSDSCMQAAQEAINGYSNIGGATHFRPASCGHEGIVIGGHVFW